jgi:excisionase family DNA binding protein
MRLKDLENWLTPGDVAQELGITRQAVHKWLQDGRLRAVKTRQGWLIDPAEVEKAYTGDTRHRSAQTRER